MASRRGLALALRLALAVVLALGLLELALHVWPGLIPQGFREAYPAHGVEFRAPGVLARTPVDGLPLPLARGGWDGPPPADLVDEGIAPPEFDGDRRRHPRVRLSTDARGLPNPTALERADVVLVGDSFLVSAASLEPPGLVPLLAEATGRVVYDLGVSGIGPLRQRWLLDELGSELEPELVVWFFFGGNDLRDAKRTLDQLASGARTRAELPGYRPPPRLILPALLGTLLRGPELAPQPPAPLPPLVFRGPDGEDRPTWLLPAHLARLGIPRAVWEAHPAWGAVREALVGARDLCRARGIGFALVYLPSKAQVHLPLVERDAELVARALAFGLDEPVERTPDETLALLLEQRGALEELVRETCAAEGIPFFSATPTLEELVRAGEYAYLAADTHWEPAGQAALVPRLVSFLRAEGLLAD